MGKKRIIDLARYLGSIMLALAVTALSVMLLLEMPGTVKVAQAETSALVSTPTARRPLPIYTASDFDVSKSVKVVVAGNAEAVTAAAQLARAPKFTEAATTPKQIRSATVTADAVNLRAAPSKDSAKVSVVRVGTGVELREVASGWTRVVTPEGIEGWLATKFLSN